MDKLKVVYVEPGKPARVIEIDNELIAMQVLVKGYIEIVKPWRPGEVLVANEEGMIRNMEPNRVIDPGKFDSIIYGPFFICGVLMDEFVTLSDSSMDKFLFKFRRPEFFKEIRLPLGGTPAYIWQKEGQAAAVIPDPRTGLGF